MSIRCGFGSRNSNNVECHWASTRSAVLKFDFFSPSGPALQPETARPRLPAHRGLVDHSSDVRVRDRHSRVKFAPKMLPHGLRVDSLFSQALSDGVVGESL